jgi:hypothetical protein
MLVSQRYARIFYFFVVFALGILLLTSLRTHRSSPPSSILKQPKLPPIAEEPKFSQQHANEENHRPPFATRQCLPEIEYLRRKELALSDNILYSRRCIKPIWGNSNRDTVQKLSEPLIKNKTTVNLMTCVHEEIPSCEELQLNVPNPYPKKQYPHLIFGVASKYDRLWDSAPATAHWLAGTEAHLVGIVVDVDEDKDMSRFTALEEEYAKWNVKATFTAPTLKKFIPGRNAKNRDENQLVPVEHHHFMLIRDLLGYATPQTQWLGILDDDTFFPSLYPVDKELAKYDHSKPFWLGALSEDFVHVKIWGLMAFGGAGVFISMPLAHELEPLLEKCIVDAIASTGDGILRDCVYLKTRTKLTIMPHLYQNDMVGDLSGFFESGVNPLGLHHWKSWYQEPIIAQAAVSALCGDCYLQRWQFGDNILLANGYSISMYRDGLGSIDLGQYEGTWESPGHPLDGHEYDYSFGPLRQKLTTEQKRSYRLKDSVVASTGALRQIYVYTSDKEKNEIDEVIELLWEP